MRESPVGNITIGEDYLRHHRLLILPAQGRMLVTAANGPAFAPFREQADRAGQAGASSVAVRTSE